MLGDLEVRLGQCLDRELGQVRRSYSKSNDKSEQSRDGRKHKHGAQAHAERLARLRLDPGRERRHDARVVPDLRDELRVNDNH